MDVNRGVLRTKPLGIVALKEDDIIFRDKKLGYFYCVGRVLAIASESVKQNKGKPHPSGDFPPKPVPKPSRKQNLKPASKSENISDKSIDRDKKPGPSAGDDDLYDASSVEDVGSKPIKEPIDSSSDSDEHDETAKPPATIPAQRAATIQSSTTNVKNFSTKTADPINLNVQTKPLRGSKPSTSEINIRQPRRQPSESIPPTDDPVRRPIKLDEPFSAVDQEGKALAPSTTSRESVHFVTLETPKDELSATASPFTPVPSSSSSSEPRPVSAPVEPVEAYDETIGYPTTAQPHEGSPATSFGGSDAGISYDIEEHNQPPSTLPEALAEAQDEKVRGSADERLSGKTEDAGNDQFLTSPSGEDVTSTENVTSAKEDDPMSWADDVEGLPEINYDADARKPAHGSSQPTPSALVAIPVPASDEFVPCPSQIIPPPETAQPVAKQHVQGSQRLPVTSTPVPKYPKNESTSESTGAKLVGLPTSSQKSQAPQQTKGKSSTEQLHLPQLSSSKAVLPPQRPNLPYAFQKLPELQQFLQPEGSEPTAIAGGIPYQDPELLAPSRRVSDRGPEMLLGMPPSWMRRQSTPPTRRAIPIEGIVAESMWGPMSAKRPSNRPAADVATSGGSVKARKSQQDSQPPVPKASLENFGLGGSQWSEAATEKLKKAAKVRLPPASPKVSPKTVGLGGSQWVDAPVGPSAPETSSAQEARPQSGVLGGSQWSEAPKQPGPPTNAPAVQPSAPKASPKPIGLQRIQWSEESARAAVSEKAAIVQPPAPQASPKSAGLAGGQWGQGTAQTVKKATRVYPATPKISLKSPGLGGSQWREGPAEAAPPKRAETSQSPAPKANPKKGGLGGSKWSEVAPTQQKALQQVAEQVPLPQPVVPPASAQQPTVYQDPTAGPPPMQISTPTVRAPAAAVTGVGMKMPEQDWSLLRGSGRGPEQIVSTAEDDILGERNNKPVGKSDFKGTGMSGSRWAD